MAISCRGQHLWRHRRSRVNLTIFPLPTLYGIYCNKGLRCYMMLVMAISCEGQHLRRRRRSAASRRSTSRRRGRRESSRTKNRRRKWHPAPAYGGGGGALGVNPPWCNTFARLLHSMWHDSPPDLPFVFAIHHALSVIPILCKGQPPPMMRADLSITT